MSVQSWMRLVRVAAVAAAFFAGGAGAGRAQGMPPVTSGLPPRPTLGSTPADDMRIPKMSPGTQEKMAIARNDERQKKLVADTDRLLALATELKAEVDKTDKYTLSLDVVKRTAEIEKLAKNIRERMKD